MDRYQLLAAVGAMNFVEAFARHLEGLRGGGFLQRQRMRSVGLDHVNGGARSLAERSSMKESAATLVERSCWPPR